MALTTDKGQNEKLDAFLDELNPLIDKINVLLLQVNNADKRISFPVRDGKIIPFISYDSTFFLLPNEKSLM